MMTNRTILVLLFISLGLWISCSDSSTGTDPNSEEPEETEESTVTTGTLEVVISTSGESLDKDGYELNIDGDSKTANANDTVVFSELEEGTYQLTLSGVAENCTVDGENTLEVTILPEETTSKDVQVTCKLVLKDKIVFVSDRDEQADLYIMGPEGNNVSRLTNTPEEERYPAISPDGTQVVFWQQDPSAGSSYGSIWIINADGSGLIQLNDRELGSLFPIWSPNGESIAFSQGGEIYTMNTDGSNRKQHTDNSGYDYAPSWSPDGEKILFSSNRADNQDIFLLDISDSELINLTKNSFYNSYASWSPDGNKIAFLSNESDPDDTYVPFDLYLMDANGDNREKIAELAVSGFRSGDKPAIPSWSPDGKEIVLGDRNGGSHEVYTISTDGSGSRNRLTLDTGFDNIYPYWSLFE